MNFFKDLMGRLVMKTQWQIYRELELIPDSVPEPGTHQFSWLARLGQRWRSLSHKPIHQLPPSQRLEYLEQCLALECSASHPETGLWKKLWGLLNQPLLGKPAHPTPLEPEIRQTCDQSGHLWWLVYDPYSGQTTYLESEEEVLLWIERRLYHW